MKMENCSLERYLVIKDAKEADAYIRLSHNQGWERWAVTSNRVVLRHAEQQRMDL